MNDIEITKEIEDEDISGLKHHIQELETSVALLASVEKKYQESEKRLQAIFSLAPDILVIFKADGEGIGEIVDQNQVAVDVHGYSIQELEQMTIFDLCESHEEYLSQDFFGRIMRGEVVTLEAVHRRKDGSLFPVEVRGTLLNLNGQRFILAFARDISNRKKAEKIILEQSQKLFEVNARLEKQVLTDGLTGAYNRRAFHKKILDEVNRTMRYKTPLSLVMADVDKFKPFNDTFGHLAGDQVLQQLALNLRSQGRKVDFVARYGGEEFIILLPNTSEEKAWIVADRLREDIASASWEHRKITVSMGVATLLNQEFETEKQAIRWMIEAADQAMYHSKELGRNMTTHINAIK